MIQELAVEHSIKQSLDGMNLGFRKGQQAAGPVMSCPILFQSCEVAPEKTAMFRRRLRGRNFSSSLKLGQSQHLRVVHGRPFFYLGRSPNRR